MPSVISAPREVEPGPVLCQGPLPISASDTPEADTAVLNRSLRHLRRLPQAADAWLAIEVSDTTLHYGRNTQAALHARARLPEHWEIAQGARQVFVRRAHPIDDRYDAVHLYAQDDAIAPLVAPENPFHVAQRMPPQTEEETR